MAPPASGKLRVAASAIALAATLGTATATLASSAAASQRQLDFFQPDDALMNPALRARSVEQMQHLGVRAIRVVLSWRDVAPRPNSPTMPRFAATNPASYNWGQYDAVIAEAQRLHWTVLLTVTAPVPKWASATRRDYLTRPNDRYFREFMVAVGRHYGSEVAYWAIWNEPNQVGWLLPQFNSNGTPASPAIYRGLFEAGYTGLVAAGLRDPRVLMGETAPFGESHVDARREGTFHNVSPLALLRGALCLNAQYHKARGCRELPAYGFAHHAYTTAAGPSYVPRGADEVTIGCLGRLVRALNLAAAAHAVRANMPIFLTEFGINTRPNSLGVSPSLQAQQDAIAEHIAWMNPRVAAFSQYALRDDPIPPHHPRGWIGFQTGLETANGALKPLYFAWPVPLVVTRQRRGYSLWGLVRPADGFATVQVLIQRRRGQRYQVLRSVRTGSLGYWTLSSPVNGVSWRVRWLAPDNVTYEGPPTSPS